jgi:hypothetical protein
MATSALLRLMRAIVTPREAEVNPVEIPELPESIKILWVAVQELNESLQQERLKRKALVRHCQELEQRLLKLECKG